MTQKALLAVKLQLPVAQLLLRQTDRQTDRQKLPL